MLASDVNGAMGWFDLDAGIAVLAGEAKAAAEKAIHTRKYGAAKAAEIQRQKFLEVQARHKRERRSAAKWMVILTSPVTVLLAVFCLPAGGGLILIPIAFPIMVYLLGQLGSTKWMHNPYK